MTISTLIQIAAACMGVIGSIFFAIGVMRQSVEAMANLSRTRYDWNPDMVSAMAAQKADYLFGGGIIVMAFGLQLLSFLVPPDRLVVSVEWAANVPGVALGITIVTFLLLWLAARRLASHFEQQIMARLKVNNAEV